MVCLVVLENLFRFFENLTYFFSFFRFIVIFVFVIQRTPTIHCKLHCRGNRIRFDVSPKPCLQPSLVYFMVRLLVINSQNMISVRNWCFIGLPKTSEKQQKYAIKWAICLLPLAWVISTFMISYRNSGVKVMITDRNCFFTMAFFALDTTGVIAFGQVRLFFHFDKKWTINWQIIRKICLFCRC